MIIKLDFESDIPIYVQLRNEVVKGIGMGEFHLGERLPSVRSLAKDIGVNVMTVNKAYQLLKQEGFISIDRRHGAKVNLVYHKDNNCREKLEEELMLLSAEAAIKGYKKEDFIKICEAMYETLHIELESD